MTWRPHVSGTSFSVDAVPVNVWGDLCGDFPGVKIDRWTYDVWCSTTIHTVVTSHQLKVKESRNMSFLIFFLIFFWHHNIGLTYFWNMFEIFLKYFWLFLEIIFLDSDPYLLTWAYPSRDFTSQRFLPKFNFSEFFQKFIGIYKEWWVWNLSGLFPEFFRKKSNMSSFPFLQFFLAKISKNHTPTSFLYKILTVGGSTKWFRSRVFLGYMGMTRKFRIL